MDINKFIENIPALIDASDGIKRMRELVLELAVRGKLTEQLPEDGSAEELLSKINAQVKVLEQNKTIKKRAIFPSLVDQEIPFPIPENWKWVRLGQTGQIYNGNSISATAKESIYSKVSEGFPFIATKDVGYGRDKLNYETGLKVPFDTEKFKVAHAGAVLICSEGGSAGKKTGLTKKDICFGNKLYANELFGGIESHLLLSIYQTPFFYEEFKSRMTGIIGGISTGKFTQIPIPLPPLAEQKRIVAQVDRLMTFLDGLEAKQKVRLQTKRLLGRSALEQLEQAENPTETMAAWAKINKQASWLFKSPENLKSLRQSILQLAVQGKLVPQDPNDEPVSELLKKVRVEQEKQNREGKAKKGKTLPLLKEEERWFEIPEGWEFERLGNYVKIISGNSFKSTDFNNIGGVKVVKITNAGVGAFVKSDDYLPKEFLIKHNTYIVEENDLVLALTRPYIAAGLKICKCPSEYNNSLLNQRVAVIKVNKNIDYVFYFMQGAYVLDLYKNRFNNTGLQPNLKVADVSNLVIPLPPLAEQKRIVAKVQSLLGLLDKAEAALAATTTTAEHLSRSATTHILEAS